MKKLVLVVIILVIGLLAWGVGSFVVRTESPPHVTRIVVIRQYADMLATSASRGERAWGIEVFEHLQKQVPGERPFHIELSMTEPNDAFGAIVLVKSDDSDKLFCVNLHEKNGYFIEGDNVQPRGWDDLVDEITEGYSQIFWIVWDE